MHYITFTRNHISSKKLGKDYKRKNIRKIFQSFIVHFIERGLVGTVDHPTMCVWEKMFSELVLILPLHLSHTLLFISSQFSLFFSLSVSRHLLACLLFLSPLHVPVLPPLMSWLERVWQCYSCAVFADCFLHSIGNFTHWKTENVNFVYELCRA